VAGRAHCKSFPAKPLADGFLVGLNDAVRGSVQVTGLLDAVRGHIGRGEHLEAFYGCLYYAYLRPSEAVRLEEADCRLPRCGWGRSDLAASAARAGERGCEPGLLSKARVADGGQVPGMLDKAGPLRDARSRFWMTTLSWPTTAHRSGRKALIVGPPRSLV
jgi:hypothetical protein